MNKVYDNTKSIADFEAVKLSIASPQQILDWSHGEVLKPETINYRTQKPEKDGLFCERIFGPVKDISPHDPRFKGVRRMEVAHDKEGKMVTRSIVRRERLGHISLAVPVTHIWFLRGTPSSVGLILDMTVKNLEKVVYFASFIILGVDEDKKKDALADLDAEYDAKRVLLKQNYEKMAEEDKHDIKVLAADQTLQLEKIDNEYNQKRIQLESFKPKSMISEGDYLSLSRDYRAIIDVAIGADAILKLLNEVVLEDLIKDLTEEAKNARGQRLRKIIKRLKMAQGMVNAGIKPEWMVMRELPVIPPDLRPMVQLTGGRFATSDLNDLYRRVINRNNRLKKLVDLNAPEVIRRNEMRMLQEAVDALIDNSNSRGTRVVSSTGGRRRLKSLSDMLKGKQGRFRQNLLGKRVDYSGRSVIVAGPELRIDECGLPKMMALELFKPFVIGNLIDNEIAHNVKAAARMIERGETEVWDALETVIEGKYVLLNRAPTLHRLGVQAFKPRLIEGKAIQLHPLVCGGFNADFDGDQMAVHLPLSDESQKEAREIMAANKNVLYPANGEPILSISQDIVLGAYYMTYEKPTGSKDARYFADTDEVAHAHKLGIVTLHDRAIIKLDEKTVETTVGRVLFNEVLPDGFPFQNEIQIKKTLKKIIANIFDDFGIDVAAETADNLKDLAFEYATQSGLSTSIDDFHAVKEKDSFLEEAEEKVAAISEQFNGGLITELERQRLTIDAWQEANEKIQTQLEKNFSEEDSSTASMIVSGARGDLSQLKQITGSIGLMQDATGNTIELPVKSNYKEGLSTLEYFTSTRSGRKGLISTALRTADSGYLTRRLVDVAQDVFTYDDPKEKFGDGLVVNRSLIEAEGNSYEDKILGRCVASAVKDNDGKTVLKKHELITKKVLAEIVEKGIDEVEILTVFSSNPSKRGINRLCFGADLSTWQLVKAHVPIGVIAAQAIGEPGTQLTLSEFHTGGVAVAGDNISQGLSRVEELFESRTPKGKAELAEIGGHVTVNEVDDVYHVTIVSADAKTSTHKLTKGLEPTIVAGERVTKNQVVATSKDAKEKIEASAQGVAFVNGDTMTIVHEFSKVKHYAIPTFRGIMVEDGAVIEQGQRLTRGSMDLQQMLKLSTQAAVQRYIMDEIHFIFSSQGQSISSKYIEVIVRQMFSRVQIDDSADSPFVIGDIVSLAAVSEVNDELLAKKKQTAAFTPLLLGVAKVATWSDSFLAAASFQDTTRVLIQAATSGSVDRLNGLKENVIIGRKVPVGTGAPVVDEV